MNMRPIWDDMRRKVERARFELPDEVIGPIVNDEFGDVFGTILHADRRGVHLCRAEGRCRPGPQRAAADPETAKVEIQGAQDERVFVEYNNTRSPRRVCPSTS